MSTTVQQCFPTNAYTAVAGQSEGLIGASTTVAVAIPTGTNGAAVDIQWTTAATTATLTLQSSNSDPGVAPVGGGTANVDWQTLPAACIVGTLTNPAGTGVGSTKVRIKDVPGARVQLLIATTVAGQYLVRSQARDI